MELKSRNVQHARDLFDRAVTLLPRVDQLWYKYVYLEELLQNVPGARQVFERWMKWEPDDKAWQAYVHQAGREIPGAGSCECDLRALGGC
jgi:crooked neck